MKKYVVASKNKVVKIKSVGKIKEFTPVACDEFGHRLKLDVPDEYSQIFKVEVENGDKLEVGDVMEHPEYRCFCLVVEVNENRIEVVFPKERGAEK